MRYDKMLLTMKISKRKYNNSDDNTATQINIKQSL